MLTLITGMRERQDDVGSGLSALMFTLQEDRETLQLHTPSVNWHASEGTDDSSRLWRHSSIWWQLWEKGVYVRSLSLFNSHSSIAFHETLLLSTVLYLQARHSNCCAGGGIKYEVPHSDGGVETIRTLMHFTLWLFLDDWHIKYYIHSDDLTALHCLI